MEPLASLTSKAFLTDGGGWVAEQDVPIPEPQVTAGSL